MAFRRLSGAVLLVAGLLLGVGVVSSSLSAATIRWVDSSTDTATSGQTSLREAIAAAESGDTIQFTDSFFNGAATRTIDLSGALVLSKSLTIVGPADAVGASVPTPRIQLKINGSSRIMLIQKPAVAVIAGLAFQGGVGAGGGAILIEAGATADFRECDFAANAATGANMGGAILNQGTLTLDQCRVTGNSAANGGGIASVGKSQVIRSQIDGNTATGFGGAIYSSAGDLWIENSTITGNKGGASGGIAFFSGGKTVTASITAVTAVHNKSAAQTAGLYVEGSGAVANVGGSIFAYNVIENNKGGQTPHDFATQKSGKINSRDYNIVVKPGTTLSPYGPNDQIGVDPRLGVLRYNGGRTQTYAIASGSPALDRGDPNFSQASTLTKPPTDQRGFARPVGGAGRVDVGAFELAAALSCPESVLVEATGATTPVTLTAALTLPNGGAITVTWKVDGATMASYPMTIADDNQPHDLTFQGSFPIRTSLANVTVTSGAAVLSGDTTVIVKDTTAPVLTLPADQTVEATSAAGATATYAATATDAVGVVSLGYSPASGNTFPLGTTSVTVTAKDAANNQATGTFTITVKDTTAPAISAPANIVAEATDATGAVVSFTASATDLGGSPVAVVADHLSGSLFPIGVTTVTLTATDGAGNTGTASFTVTVRDSTAPLIAAQDNLVIEATGADGAVATFTLAASDIVSGAVVVSATPASGSTFPIGITTVNLTATDAANNVAKSSFTVTVKDTTAPAISVPVDVTLEATSPAGAVATYSVTANDLVDGAVAVTASPASGSTFALGTTIVSLTAVDSRGNASGGSFKVTVRDTTAPVIGAQADLTLEATSAAGAVATFAPTATDAVSTPTVTSLPVSGSTFALGTTKVTITATDAANNASSKEFFVKVQDTTAPVLGVPGNFTVEGTSPAGAAATFSATATDAVGATVTYSKAPGSTFAFGTTTVLVTAADAAGNTSTGSFSVTVRDTTPPSVSLIGSGAMTLQLGTDFVDPDVNATDQCSLPVTVKRIVTVGGLPSSGVDTSAPGTYLIRYTATDSAGNSAWVERTVVVAASIKLGVDPVVTRTIDAALRAALVDLSKVVTVTGVPANCADKLSFVVTVTPPKGNPITLAGVPGDALPTYKFAVGTSAVGVNALLRSAGGNTEVYGTAAFSVVVDDPYGVTLTNVAWPLAIDLAPKFVSSGNSSSGVVRQMIAQAGESRWYKFHGRPGSRIEVALSNLPGNFDVVVYTDIEKVYKELLGLTGSSSDAEQKLALLGAEFAGESYSSPEAYSPESYAAPEAYSPESYASPEAYSPESYSSPEAYSPEAFTPEGYALESYSAPEAYSPEAYTSAQQRSLFAFSASPGTVSERIRFNTYSRSGEFYIRIRGQNGVYSTEAPYVLTVGIQENLCSGVTDLNTTPATIAPVATGATSLIVWDSKRVVGDANALGTSLANLAAAANGLLVDVANDAQIVKLNAQADANKDCVVAKNLVADAIRNLILAYRAGSPTIADITLSGNDAVIPFFRSDDKALLASEANYFPPVFSGTASQASLRAGQILSQDRYGSSHQVVLSTGPYDLPEIPVGRLVETAGEMKAYVDKYLALFTGPASTGGVIKPKSGFVAGYDFLADASEAMKLEFSAGLAAGAKVSSLISPYNEPPELGWTADQLRTAFLGSRSDIAYLAGHFSTGRALAADYVTRFRAGEVADSTLDLAYSLVLSAGCHSGYNTVDADAIPLLTEMPDWAQAFARKNAIWIAGTGYQYGDTDFIDYTERLMLEVFRALRTGAGPVSIGQALVDGKRRYLADTAVMRGIHEKSLLELVLYGLPMVKFDLPGRLATPAPVGDVHAVAGVPTGPGTGHSLKQGDLTINPVLTRVDRTLDVVGSNDTIVASYFKGSDGILSILGEPVRPLERFNVSRPEGFVRGIGFRAGQYSDLAGFVPFTGAPATETGGVHGRFLTEVFYPSRPWNLNQMGELVLANGVSTLNIFPTQFLSDNLESATGTLRKYGQMQFTVFYCPEASMTALASPPAINVVSSTVSETDVAFAVDAAAAGGVGVQEVWVTYTGLPGSPYYGAWRSLTLTAPAETTGLGTWTGTLPLPAANREQFRFIVQAVNGVGGVTQNTNFGHYFKAGTSTLDGIGVVGVSTKLALVAPVPTGGGYRSPVMLQARLTDVSDQPLAGKRVQFRVGPLARMVISDANGMASASLVLDARPGAYSLEANFAGDAAYQDSSDARAFTVTKMASQLVFDAPAVVTEGSNAFAVLRAIDGTPLKERTVVFVLDNGSAKTTQAEITDGLGRARLITTGLASGNYQVSAYFAVPVTLPDGNVVELSDPLYVGSSASRSLTAGTSLRFGDEQAWVNYSDAAAPGATANNAGVSKVEVFGAMASSAPNFGPNSILASTKATKVTAYLSARLSGKTLAAGSVQLKVQANDNTHWRGDAVINGCSIQLNVDWDGSGGSGKYHVWVYPPSGSGPLFNAVPALLNFELILGTGAGERPAGGASQVGDAAKPWSQVTGASRVRSQ